MSEFRELLRGYSDWLPEITEAGIGLLEVHYLKLLSWMPKMNLTSITSHREIVLRHYVECAWFAGLLPEGRVIADCGSGAGFPGVPMAAVRPHSEVVLIEADHRKGVFLRESTLGFPNVSVEVGRLERARSRPQGVLARGVDVVAVRAFGEAHAEWVAVLTSAEIAAKFKWDMQKRLLWDENHVAAFFKVPRETP